MNGRAPISAPQLKRGFRTAREKHGATHILAAAIKSRSIAFETNCHDLPGEPDIVIRQRHLAVFVNQVLADQQPLAATVTHL